MITPKTIRDTTALQKQLENGLDPNTVVKYEETFHEEVLHRENTLLTLAGSVGALESVRLLLEKKADPNKQIEGHSPLLATTLMGKQDCILELLKNGANPNIPNRKGVTPIFFTIAPGEIRLLMEYGAIPTMQNLYHAIQSNEKELFNEMLPKADLFFAKESIGFINAAELLAKAKLRDVSQNTKYPYYFDRIETILKEYDNLNKLRLFIKPSS